QVNEYNYYRLKMVDIDGKFTYSSIILIKDINVSQHIWVGNNPFHDIINIRIAKNPQQDIKVELMNENGAKVYFKEFGNTNQVSVNVSGMNLASGVYLLRTTVDGKIYTNKLLKQ
ncbi:MAG TPA: T9SS type A sorting domain-containing protein, partial [Ginsengibacter sp.]